MKNLTLAIAAIVSIGAFGTANAFEPIKGSLGYAGSVNQVHGFSAASVGQPTWNTFTNPNGYGDVRELSVLKADGSYEVLSRFIVDSK